MKARDAGTDRNRVVSGAVLVALYVVVAAATASWAPGRMRPLFDGFGSHPGQYNWVAPPKEFAEGNQEPESSEVEMEFDEAGSMPTSTGPNDGQALITLVPGAVAARAGDTKATVTLTPVDPAELGPLPTGLRPEGNAYQVAIAYQPSGAKVVTLDKPSSVGLTSAAPADTLLFSLDGKAWRTEQGQSVPGGTSITGPLTSTGYYLAAAKGSLREAASGSGSGGGGKVALIVAALAVPVVLGWLLLFRRRPATAARGKGGPVKQRPGASGRPAPGRRPPTKTPPKQAGPAKGAKGRGSEGGKGTGKGGR